MTGYLYGEPEPKTRCPYCDASCHADFVDVGVGMQQCGPYHCEACGASEIGPFDEHGELTPAELKTGWYKPGSPPGTSANQIDGKHVSWQEADTAYRAQHGVPPRYTGRLRTFDRR